MQRSQQLIVVIFAN